MQLRLLIKMGGLPDAAAGNAAKLIIERKLEVLEPAWLQLRPGRRKKNWQAGSPLDNGMDGREGHVRERGRCSIGMHMCVCGHKISGVEEVVCGRRRRSDQLPPHGAGNQHQPRKTVIRTNRRPSISTLTNTVRGSG